jgi:hypothetical protein
MLVGGDENLKLASLHDAKKLSVLDTFDPNSRTFLTSCFGRYRARRSGTLSSRTILTALM